MSEFVRLQNAEKFYKVKIQQQERMLQDLQVERQAMYQVIGALIVQSPTEVNGDDHSVSLDLHMIGTNYNIWRVDTEHTFTYHATILPGE